ncbi:hypothetical protein [Oligoflexus tunisiensis]|uniref:hypothetical protein n=1 Tax=Oligoflexus tunisiensis TaxID=708132 RepID=UPI00114CFF6B|nr:hypothetical protein [Oligoflexus tunisiensis]
MLRKSILCWGLGAMAMAASAAETETPAQVEGQDDEQSAEPLSASDRASALAYTQKELQDKFQTGASLDLGRVTPWSELGAAFFGRIGGPISSLSLGFGDFEYSGNLNQRNYMVSGHAESAYVAARYFVLGFGPLYVEPAIGLVHWNGDVKPRGNDDIDDIAASALTSRFDLLGADIDVNLGIMWLFTNGVFVDYNFLNLSHALLLQESYTVSTSEARKAIRTQIAGPISMSGINLRVGYAFDF